VLAIETLSVAAIEKGTVIDHIPAGSALSIFDLLQLRKFSHCISIGLNLPSQKKGRKDLIKIENHFLQPKEVHDIAIFAPQATINIILNFEVITKMTATLPDAVEKILICPNQHCITHVEPVFTIFFVEEFKRKVQLSCKYCEREFTLDELVGYSS
jgi:aspartate carbamoyltransferase regulatory subunit